MTPEQIAQTLKSWEEHQKVKAEIKARAKK